MEWTPSVGNVSRNGDANTGNATGDGHARDDPRDGSTTGCSAATITSRKYGKRDGTGDDARASGMDSVDNSSGFDNRRPEKPIRCLAAEPHEFGHPGVLGV